MSAVWRPGDVVLGRYEVKTVHENGGMGLVYRVRHRRWNTDLAIKVPRPGVLNDPAFREQFVAEAETWVGLGTHPHVCTCHYVSVEDGVPRVFAEYLEGGSLRDWIDDRRLYRGDPTAALARILDLTIQICWGLDHAHVNGLIHQDVKPGNILLDADGQAKVTDFGLARAAGALVTAPGTATSPATVTMIATAGGLTPAYASPEQVAGAKLTRRTDVWSLAVVVLEMFTGRLTWPFGPMAGAALAEHPTRPPAQPHLPPIPAPLADLLGRCLQDDPGQRPARMTDLAAELARIHHETLGRPYSRAAPRQAELRADELTNRGLSLLDLGRTAEAEQAFAEALAADPQHIEATYNAGLLRWRQGQLSDTALLTSLDTVRATLGDPWPARYLTAQVHLERGDLAAAETLLADAGDDPDVSAALAEVRSGVAAEALAGFDGHGTAVMSVAVAADRHVAVTGDAAGTLRVWDFDEEPTLRYAVTAHEKAVLAVAISADARVAVSVGADGTVHVRELERVGRRSRRRELTLDGHIDAPTRVAISHDGRRVLTNDRVAVRVWDAGNGRCLRFLTGHTGRVAIVAVSGDGRRAMSVADDRTVRYWDLETGACLRVLRGPEWIGHGGVSADGRLGLAASRETGAHLWDLADGRLLRTVEAHADVQMGLLPAPAAISADGRRMITAGRDHTFRLWETATGRCLRTYTGHEAEVWAVALTGDGRFAASADRAGVLRWWRLPAAHPSPYRLCRPRTHVELSGLRDQVDTLLARAGQDLVAGRYPAAHTLLSTARATPAYEREPRVLDAWRRLGRHATRVGIRAVWPVRTLTDAAGITRGVSLDADGTHALTASDNAVRLWRTDGTGAYLEHDTGDWPTTASLSADAAVGLTAGKRLHVWDARTGELRRSFGGHTLYAVLSVHLGAEGRSAVSGGGDNAVRLWDLDAGTQVRAFEGHGSRVTSVRFGPGERHILSASADGHIRLWDAAGGECVQVFPGHRGSVATAVLTPDGETVVSGGEDGTIRRWDAATGECLSILEGHTGRVNELALSGDGRFAASAGHDDTVRLWDLETGRCLHTVDGHTYPVWSVSWSSDGRYLLSGSHDRGIRLWEIDWDLA
jgi:WD40 repeat protein